MSGIAVTDLATRAGIAENELHHLAECGLLRREDDGRFAADSLIRLDLIAYANQRGISSDDLATAVAEQGDLLHIFVELHTGVDRSHNVDEAARIAGIDPELMSELRDVLGWDDPAASADDIEALRLLAAALNTGLPKPALIQLVGVYADAMDRLADAESRLFHQYVHDQFRVDGLRGVELLQATHEIGEPLLDMIEPALVYFHRRSFARAAREDLLRHVTEDITPRTPGQSHATVVFIDLASFTPLTAAMGDDNAADVLSRFARLVRRRAREHNGNIIKQIGDAFMLTFAKPDDAVSFGVGAVAAAAAEPQFPALHVGAHHGALLFREGDYVGATVNLAARVASASEAGQFLITEATAELVGEIAGTLREVTPKHLKGIHEAVALREVVSDHATHAGPTDPVCGMRLTSTAATLEYEGTTFAFCSDACADAFRKDPAHYDTSRRGR